MPTCPECGFYVAKKYLVKEWVKSWKRPKINIIVKHWKCKHCGHEFQTIAKA
ncbi:MAG: hypothetical protein QW821_05425 [Candidatus Bathyarchaeia archaeon]